MVVDASVSDAGEMQPAPSRRPRRLRRWLLYALLAVSGFHMLGTGSPIPLVHIERLHDPAAVTAIGEDSLQLRDGRKIRLPFIKRLPKSDPCFAKALAHGVEIAQGGAVFGLIDPIRQCGNDPTIFYRVRINLSELAGVLDPDGIDEVVVRRELIEEFKQNRYTRSRDRRGLPVGLLSSATYLRRYIYEASAEPARAEAVIARSFSLK
jgi:hypothetical protein